MTKTFVQPKIVRFEDIVVWQKAQELTVNIYKCSRTIKDYGYRDRLQRAVISIASNIAEGYERNTNKEFRQFLYIAKGSASEVRSLINIGHRLGYLDKEESDDLNNQAEVIARMLSGLIKTL